jgi:hypothetical protein
MGHIPKMVEKSLGNKNRIIKEILKFAFYPWYNWNRIWYIQKQFTLVSFYFMGVQILCIYAIVKACIRIPVKCYIIIHVSQQKILLCESMLFCGLAWKFVTIILNWCHSTVMSTLHINPFLHLYAFVVWPSVDQDQPAHPCRLIRIYIVHFFIY